MLRSTLQNLAQRKKRKITQFFLPERAQKIQILTIVYKQYLHVSNCFCFLFFIKIIGDEANTVFHLPQPGRPCPPPHPFCIPEIAMQQKLPIFSSVASK